MTSRSEYRTDSDPGEPWFDPGPMREPVIEQQLWRKVVAAMLADAQMGRPPIFGDSVEKHDRACDIFNWSRRSQGRTGGKAGLVRKWTAYCREPWFHEICSLAGMDHDKTAREILTRAKESRW